MPVDVGELADLPHARRKLAREKVEYTIRFQLANDDGGRHVIENDIDPSVPPTGSDNARWEPRPGYRPARINTPAIRASNGISGATSPNDINPASPCRTSQTPRTSIPAFRRNTNAIEFL